MKVHIGPRRVVIAAFLGALIAPAPAARAADPGDPEWPCIQRKAPRLSVAQMWPALGEAPPQEADAETRALAQRLAQRRLAVEEAEPLVAAFAEASGDRASERLPALFGAVFDIVQRERDEVMAGITRYAHRQEAIAQRIEERRAELERLRAAAPPDMDRIEEAEDALVWEERIFRERRQSLTYVCEAPVILEQRVFTLARIIEARTPEP